MRTRLLRAQTHLQEKKICLSHASPRSNQLMATLKHTRVRLQQAHTRLFTQAYNRWQVAQRGLQCLDPERTLARGYAVLFNQHGEVVRHPEQLEIAVPMQLQLAQGSVQLELSKIKIKNKSDK
jgi:exodeoxyribonuclease VII large subunit